MTLFLKIQKVFTPEATVQVSIVIVIKGELASKTVNYDTKTTYQFEPKFNLLRSTLQVKQQVSVKQQVPEAVVCRFLKIS